MSETTSENARGPGAAAILAGSCLCGAVAYRIRGPFRLVARCHCRMCQKASGAEFATNASADRSGFEIVRGGDRVRSHESSPGQYREFCGDCGSPLWKRTDADPDTIRIRLGTLDDSSETPVQVRVFTDQKHALTEIPDDGVPTFAGRPGEASARSR